MKTKPILFSTPMVQALVDDSKNQTRREIFGRNTEMIALMINILAGCEVDKNKAELMKYSRIQIGDTLWVREAWNYSDDLNEPYWYRQAIVDEYKPEFQKLYKWKPSIHMPKDAARIFLKVTDVRIELLQDISPDDAAWEGIEEINADYHSEPGAVHADYKNYLWVDDEKCEDWIFPYYADPISSFKSLWQKINGLESWDLNPLVWVISFERIPKPFEADS